MWYLKIVLIFKFVDFLVCYQSYEDESDSLSNENRNKNSKLKCRHSFYYQENNCNICKCNWGHLENCTPMKCTGRDYHELKNCRIGETWQQGCQKCMCLRIYGTICEINDCSTYMTVRPPTTPWPNKYVCRHGMRYVVNACLNCRCRQQYLVECQDLGCNHVLKYVKEEYKQCKVGSRWNIQDCNIRCECVARIGGVCDMSTTVCDHPWPEKQVFAKMRFEDYDNLF